MRPNLFGVLQRYFETARISEARLATMGVSVAKTVSQFVLVAGSICGTTTSAPGNGFGWLTDQRCRTSRFPFGCVVKARPMSASRAGPPDRLIVVDVLARNVGYDIRRIHGATDRDDRRP